MASGTATLEATLVGTPMVVTYRVSAVTHWLAHRLASTRYVALPNILLNDGVVPEFMQHEVTAERLAAAALEILENPARAAAMRSRLRQVRSLLGEEGFVDRAAGLILQEAGVRTEPVRPAGGGRDIQDPS